VESTGKTRTQNPPPLKACRFDSDLGHQFDQRFTRSEPVTGTTSQTHRTFHCGATVSEAISQGARLAPLRIDLGTTRRMSAAATWRFSYGRFES